MDDNTTSSSHPPSPSDIINSTTLWSSDNITTSSLSTPTSPLPTSSFPTSSVEPAVTSALTLSMSKNVTILSSVAETFENSTFFSDNNSTEFTTDIVLVNRTLNETPFYLKFREDAWVIPLVSLALLNVCAILFFEIYVLYKSCGGKRHLFLGQVLLLGLLLSSVLALVYVLEPYWLLCGITRAGIGLMYSLVFGVLLVKCVFLLKFHYGIYFNASMQALLLFFIVAVEVAIVVQWLVYHPPAVVSYFEVGGQVTPVCDISPLERIPYLTYAMLLMVMVIVGAVRARSLRENNREAMYIGLSIAVALVSWVAWTSVSLIFDRKYENPAEAFGLVITSLLVFLLVFMPKAVQLARGKGRHRSGSGRSALHTPSFLQLQPHAVLPTGSHGTLVKHTPQLNVDYCRNGYNSRLWRYDYPSFHQAEPPAIAVSDMTSTKKSNGSSNRQSQIYT